MEKAYDIVPLQKLWRASEDMEINKILIKVRKNLYTNAVSKIKIRKFLSEEIKVEKGFRQGCSISPSIFKIFIHTALLNWNR